VRRTGEDTGAARATSSRGKSGRREPNRRSDASKPDRTTPPAAAEATTTGQPITGQPMAEAFLESGLAPGLYLVATPIGNLGDVTLRALEVLQRVDRIFCEDTRITARLLARYGISTPIEAYHDHNAEQMRPVVLAALHRGESVALVSDAGTPLVSDPGYKLVRAAIAENLTVTAAPGPSAALTALILSGLPPDTFLFAGFLPPRQTARRGMLERWGAVEATLVFFESTQRLAESLADMAETLGDRPAAVARELTKLHEEIRRGRLADLADHYRDAGPPRGEAVVVIGPPEWIEPDRAEIDGLLRAALAELGVRDAAAKLAAETGLPRGELYRRALAIRAEKG
jgi:16S rRNA (cytidine1402-2'-O)-methyltransferase